MPFILHSQHDVLPVERPGGECYVGKSFLFFIILRDAKYVVWAKYTVLVLNVAVLVPTNRFQGVKKRVVFIFR